VPPGASPSCRWLPFLFYTIGLGAIAATWFAHFQFTGPHKELWGVLAVSVKTTLILDIAVLLMYFFIRPAKTVGPVKAIFGAAWPALVIGALTGFAPAIYLLPRACGLTTSGDSIFFLALAGLSLLCLILLAVVKTRSFVSGTENSYPSRKKTFYAERLRAMNICPSVRSLDRWRIALARGFEVLAVFATWIVFIVMFDKPWDPIGLVPIAFAAWIMGEAMYSLVFWGAPKVRPTKGNRMATGILVALCAPALLYLNVEKHSDLADVVENLSLSALALATLSSIVAHRGIFTVTHPKVRLPSKKKGSLTPAEDGFLERAGNVCARADSLRDSVPEARKTALDAVLEAIGGLWENPASTTVPSVKKHDVTDNEQYSSRYGVIFAYGFLTSLALATWATYFWVLGPPRSLTAFLFPVVVSMALFESVRRDAPPDWIDQGLDLAAYASLSLLGMACFEPSGLGVEMLDSICTSSALLMAAVMTVSAVSLSVLSVMHGYDFAIQEAKAMKEGNPTAEADFGAFVSEICAKAEFLRTCSPEARKTAVEELEIAAGKLEGCATALKLL